LNPIGVKGVPLRGNQNATHSKRGPPPEKERQNMRKGRSNAVEKKERTSLEEGNFHKDNSLLSRATLGLELKTLSERARFLFLVERKEKSACVYHVASKQNLWVLLH
jgi:hypothetical protein